MTADTSAFWYALAALFMATLSSATPLVLAAMGGVLSERAGVVNIAIEGMMLGAAMMAALMASVTHNLWLGVLGGVLTGGLLALIHAIFSIRYKVDQIISGTVLPELSKEILEFSVGVHELIQRVEPQWHDGGLEKIRLRLPQEQEHAVEILGKGAEAAPRVVELFQKLGLI